jgi:hypothetical protein
MCNQACCVITASAKTLEELLTTERHYKNERRYTTK